MIHNLFLPLLQVSTEARSKSEPPPPAADTRLALFSPLSLSFPRRPPTVVSVSIILYKAAVRILEHRVRVQIATVWPRVYEE